MTDAGAAPRVGPAPQQADAVQTDAAKRVKGRIGEKLLALGLITPDQLRIGLREKQRSSKMLGAILVELGFVGEAQLAQVLAEATGLERFDPKTTLADPDVVRLVPKEVALKYKVLPFSMKDRTAHVAMADAYDVLALDQVRRFLPQGVTIQPCVCPAADLSEAIDRAYGYEMSIDGILSELAGLSTKSAKIRALSAAGYSRAEIARFLDIRYQHVYNVLKRSKAVESGRRLWTKIGPGGRVVIPAAYRRALNLAEGSDVQLRLEGDEVHVIPRDVVVRRVQAIVRRHVPEGVSLSDELIAERRAEAKREASAE